MRDKIYLGKTKFEPRENVCLENFKWQCNWYWGGGYVGNKNFHCHFDGCFLKKINHYYHPLGNFKPLGSQRENAIIVKSNSAIFEPISTFLDNVPEHIENNWWRIKDLYKQFYALKQAAEVFQYGGHCTTSGRKPEEINLDMAKQINQHLQYVIIPEIMRVCQFGTEDEIDEWCKGKV